MPAIELFGKQTLYSSGIRKNLVPRSLIGVGFTWNLFDGLGREKQIRQAKINHRILTVEKEKAADDLTLAVDKFYNQTQTALDNVTALQTTVEMSREIVRARHKSFQEGMATPHRSHRRGTAAVESEGRDPDGLLPVRHGAHQPVGRLRDTGVVRSVQPERKRRNVPDGPANRRCKRNDKQLTIS